MSLWYVYIVECADGTLYTGTSNNVERRVAQHNSGKGAKYISKKRRPVKLKFALDCANRSLACQLEHEIKQSLRKEKLEYIALNNRLNKPFK